MTAAVSGSNPGDPVGYGYYKSGLGSLVNAGKLTFVSGETETIPSGATVTNDGTLINKGTITNSGIITNSGTMSNHGTIKLVAPGKFTVLSSGPVEDHNYIVGFTVTHLPGTPPAPPSLHIYAASLSAAGAALPTVTLPAGHAFSGWYHTTAQITTATVLPGSSTAPRS